MNNIRIELKKLRSDAESMEYRQLGLIVNIVNKWKQIKEIRKKYVMVIIINTDLKTEPVSPLVILG